MTATGYFTKEASQKKEYKNTSIDVIKNNADALLQSIDGNWYTLFLNVEIKISGRGIKAHSDKIISVTESVYNKIKNNYKIETDF